MNRRTFLKIAGIGSIAVAAAGCTSQPEKNLFTLVHAPDDMVAGKANWYASTCRECPAGCGVLAKNREGRVIKLEGNPHHPINRGALCMRGQAALQGIYDPDRLKTPMIQENGAWRSISFEDAEALIARRAMEASGQGPNRVRMLSEITGDSLLALFQEALRQWGADGPVLFEPYAYESLKAANEAVFGIAAVPALHMDRADLLIGFGADFLETWVSPVEYAQKFKAMHALRDGKKRVFIQVSPFESLTAANADRWLACMPGGEAAVVYGLIRELLARGRGQGLPVQVRDRIARVCEPFSPPEVVRLSDIREEDFQMLANRLLDAKAPLVLGSGIGAGGADSFRTDFGVVLLNLILDPRLGLYDFENRHRIERAARRSEVLAFLDGLEKEPAGLLLLHNTNPVFTLPPSSRAAEIISRKDMFVVSFTNFMDETAALSDLVFPIQLPLETWDAYEAKTAVTGTLQPAMGKLMPAPAIGDVFLRCAFGGKPPAPDYKTYVAGRLNARKAIENDRDWVAAIQAGGIFKAPSASSFPGLSSDALPLDLLSRRIRPMTVLPKDETILISVPSSRFFDGRGANKSWLCEAPDPLTLICWQSVVQVHPETMAVKGWKQGDVVELRSRFGTLKIPVFECPGIRPGVMAMAIGQGHTAFGRYARNQGQNPLTLLDAGVDPESGGPSYLVHVSAAAATGQKQELAHLDGSRIQHGRKIALATELKILQQPLAHAGEGLGMWEFPFTLPLPEGYDGKRDIYPSHSHADYRWGMVVDLDRCIGCGACTIACYAENNIGMVREKQILAGREMAWLRIERYHDPEDYRKIIFLPMMCQHCDNAPCEAVCPVYAPHHSKEGLNNQIYNRCIGTRFCGQNCPYKVRRFNWLAWERPEPLPMQLNPDVTVRTTGVMEKCSFCIQRIKDGHDAAKNEDRKIRDGEVIPACVQTCPTHALVFGNFMDPQSQVRRLIDDRRAYQVLGYLNTKPAVIYLKKVLQDI
ncbi:MAG: 4Fe-4S dicluster domain-containing protein [Deltaproteobacteria bacterium]|nr:4Fe-4S dicluster domain-containing protein [Deltaproteobacteria bacterium]